MGGQDPPGAVAKADAVALPLRMATQGQRIAILKKTAGLAGCQRNGFFPAPASSSRLPRLSLVGPDMVPEPRISPTFIGQPEVV